MLWIVIALDTSLEEGVDQFDEGGEEEDIFGQPGVAKRQLIKWKMYYFGHCCLDTKSIMIEAAG